MPVSLERRACRHRTSRKSRTAAVLLILEVDLEEVRGVRGVLSCIGLLFVTGSATLV